MEKERAITAIIDLIEIHPAFIFVKGLEPNYKDAIRHLLYNQEDWKEFYCFDKLDIIGCRIINDEEGVAIEITFLLSSKMNEPPPLGNGKCFGFAISPKHLHPSR